MALLACKSFLSIDFAHFNTFFLFSFLLSTKLCMRGGLKFAVFKQELGVDGAIIDIVSFTIQIKFLFFSRGWVPRGPGFGFVVLCLERCFVTWLRHHWLACMRDER